MTSTRIVHTKYSSVMLIQAFEDYECCSNHIQILQVIKTTAMVKGVGLALVWTQGPEWCPV